MQLTKATQKGTGYEEISNLSFPYKFVRFSQRWCVGFLSENKTAIENKLFICFLSQSWRAHKTASHRYE